MTYHRIHSWKWTPEEPWPPISYLIDCEIWKLPQYSTLRAKLSTPVPTPLLTASDDGFVTITSDTDSKIVEGLVPGTTDRCVCIPFATCSCSDVLMDFVFGFLVRILFQNDICVVYRPESKHVFNNNYRVHTLPLQGRTCAPCEGRTRESPTYCPGQTVFPLRDL